MSCNKTLKTLGYKLTPQRRVILDIIHETDVHLTADDIYSRVQERIQGVNKCTVYRTLELLAELNCVVKNDLGERAIYHHAEEGHHHHLVCRHCGKNIDCDEDVLHSVERDLLKEYGFAADMQHMVIKGLCRDCREASV